jgi:hypothetical protein
MPGRDRPSSLPTVSKAFTKEDEEGGVALPNAESFVVPKGPFRITARGAALLARATDPRARALLARAEVLTAGPRVPTRVALGVTVRTQSSSGGTKSYRIVTPEEQALTGDGCSIESPIGRALLGAQVGDVREIQTPRELTELEVLSLEGDSPEPERAGA